MRIVQRAFLPYCFRLTGSKNDLVGKAHLLNAVGIAYLAYQLNFLLGRGVILHLGLDENICRSGRCLVGVPHMNAERLYPDLVGYLNNNGAEYSERLRAFAESPF